MLVSNVKVNTSCYSWVFMSNAVQDYKNITWMLWHWSTWDSNDISTLSLGSHAYTSVKPLSAILQYINTYTCDQTLEEDNQPCRHKVTNFLIFFYHNLITVYTDRWSLLVHNLMGILLQLTKVWYHIMN